MVHRLLDWQRRVIDNALGHAEDDRGYNEVQSLNRRAHRLLTGSDPQPGQPVADYLNDEAAQRQLWQRLAAEGWRLAVQHQYGSTDSPDYRAGFEHDGLSLYWHTRNQHSAAAALVQGILDAINFGHEYAATHPKQRPTIEHA
jgi:hypothetical protein